MAGPFLRHDRHLEGSLETTMQQLKNLMVLSIECTICKQADKRDRNEPLSSRGLSSYYLKLPVEDWEYCCWMRYFQPRWQIKPYHLKSVNFSLLVNTGQEVLGKKETGKCIPPVCCALPFPLPTLSRVSYRSIKILFTRCKWLIV